MKQLITAYPTPTTIELNGSNQQLINAYDLYKFLGLTTRFGRWIADLIERYDFKDNLDYATGLISDYAETNPAGSKVYYLTEQMTKEVCLVSNTVIGQQYRRYLINLERDYISKLQSRPQLPSHKSHYTIRDFIAYKGMSNMPKFDTRKLAFKLTKICKDNGIEIKHKDSKSYDTINMYPFEVLVAHLAK